MRDLDIKKYEGPVLFHTNYVVGDKIAPVTIYDAVISLGGKLVYANENEIYAV